jgi:type VI secretion system secreted protein VgrG
MTLNVTVDFPDSSPDLGDQPVIRRYELREALGALFELTLEILSTNPALDDSTIVGQAVTVSLGDEPFLKELRGVVCRMEQRTAVPSGTSHYALTIVPPLWLTTRRRDSRIFQNLSVPDIVNAVLADPSYAGRIPAPDTAGVRSAPVREYVVQYAETDHDFLARILADEGITGFFDHTNSSIWTLTDDTASAALELTDAIPFSDPTHQNPIVLGDPSTAHVQTAVISTGVETSAVTLRDYDFEKPDLLLQAKQDAGDAITLEAYAYEVGKFAQQAPGEQRAQRHLDARRLPRRRILCTASFALPPGAKLPLVDHPREDLAGDFLVVRARTVMEGYGRGTHELELMDLAAPFRPALLPKPRIHGSQTAFVVGADGAEVDVDRHGRVLVEFRWDRRDRHTGETSRRVRVSQGWAGADRGFVMLPRVKDEVVVAYLDGDPDQPLVVGRVHNGVSTSPLNLPGDKAISVWRSKSTPGGAGYNEILMDDKAGAERLDMHAQLDHKLVVERDAETVIGRHEKRTVKGNRTVGVVGNQADSVSGDKSIDVTGDLSLYADNILIQSKADTKIHAGAYMMQTAATNRDDLTGGNHTINAKALFLKGEDGVQVVGPKIHVFGGQEIHLQVGGSSIHITGGGIKIRSGGDVEINGTNVKLNC